MAQHQIEIYSVDYDDNPIYKANVVVCNRDDFADLMWHLDQIKGLTEGFRASTIIDGEKRYLGAMPAGIYGWL